MDPVACPSYLVLVLGGHARVVLVEELQFLRGDVAGKLAVNEVNGGGPGGRVVLGERKSANVGITLVSQHF